MKVKFANAEVDVWKLRKGTVLAREEHNYIQYMHLETFANHYALGHELKLTMVEDGGSVDYYPCELQWLEPF
jgi:hypothetical protein